MRSSPRTPRSAGPVRRGLLLIALATIVAVPLAIVPALPAAAAAQFDQEDLSFVSATSVTVSGTKDTGSTLLIRRNGAVVCTVGDLEAVTWSCPGISVPNGLVEVTGEETLADSTVVAMSPLRLRVLAAPAIDGAGSAVITTGRFSGFAEPGAGIQLSSTGPGGTQSHGCPAALGNGFWSCVVDLPNGSYQLRAIQSLPALGPELSAPSAAVNAIIDRTPPAPPTLTSPPSGPTTQPGATARGGGERDALLQVFVNGELACETTVTPSGSWECPLRWPRPGTWSVQALQRDQAGNFSSASERAEVRYAPPAPPPAEEGDEPPPALEPSPEQSTPVPDAPEPPRSPAAPITSNWGTATGFGGSLPSAAEVAERGGWLVAPLAGLAYLLLMALPLRWFATHVRPRLWRPRLQLTGRNRGRAMPEEPRPALSPLLMAAGTLGGAAVIAALSGGIDAEVRYLRLTAGIGLGLLVLNIVGVLLPARIAGRLAGATVGVRLLPGILLVAAAAALVSRLVELQPPLLVGVLIAAAGGARRRVRAGVAVAQTSGVAVLAVLGWAAHDLLTPSTGFWMTLAAETSAAIALGGLASLLMLLLPVGPLPGRTLYAVSPPAWAAVTLVSASLVGAILTAGPAFPLLTLILVAAGFAAVLLALTVWVRWVAPSLR